MKFAHLYLLVICLFVGACSKPALEKIPTEDVAVSFTHTDPASVDLFELQVSIDGLRWEPHHSLPAGPGLDYHTKLRVETGQRYLFRVVGKKAGIISDISPVFPLTL